MISIHKKYIAKIGILTRFQSPAHLAWTPPKPILYSIYCKNTNICVQSKKLVKIIIWAGSWCIFSDFRKIRQNRTISLPIHYICADHHWHKFLAWHLNFWKRVTKIGIHTPVGLKPLDLRIFDGKQNRDARTKFGPGPSIKVLAPWNLIH